MLDGIIDRLKSMTPLSREAQEFLDKREADKKTYADVEALRNDLGKRYGPFEAHLDRFVIRHPGQQETVERLRSLDLSAILDRGGGLCFYGPVGTGKDHLAAAMMYRVIKTLHKTCRWINCREWFGTMRDQLKLDLKEENLVRQLVVPDILTLSDPLPAGGKGLTDWQADCLYRIVDKRNRSLKSTWLTVNAESIEDADQKLSSPVFDRLLDQAVIFKCFWPSFRSHNNGVTHGKGS